MDQRGREEKRKIGLVGYLRCISRCWFPRNSCRCVLLLLLSFFSCWLNGNRMGNGRKRQRDHASNSFHQDRARSEGREGRPTRWKCELWQGNCTQGRRGGWANTLLPKKRLRKNTRDSLSPLLLVLLRVGSLLSRRPPGKGGSPPQHASGRGTGDSPPERPAPHTSNPNDVAVTAAAVTRSLVVLSTAVCEGGTRLG